MTAVLNLRRESGERFVVGNIWLREMKPDDWSAVWSDPKTAGLILQHGRVFAETRRMFSQGLQRFAGPLDHLTILDFGCGDGQLLAGITCTERLLYEPSPVYAPALTEYASRLPEHHRVRRVTTLGEIPDASVDLVIMHSVAQYLTLEQVADHLLSFRRILTRDSRGVIIADLPNPNPAIDAVGALTAHPRTVVQVLSQIARLLVSSYSAIQLHRHRHADLVDLAARTGYQCKRLRTRSFNRARLTVLLEARPNA